MRLLLCLKRKLSSHKGNDMPILQSAGAGSVRGFGLFGASAPVNLSAPVLSGTATVGQTLSSSTGTWSGSPDPTFTYQWTRNGSNISGATSSSYLLVSDDYNTSVRCVVTATNIVAAVSANSNAVTIAGTVPVNTVAPTISLAGSILTTTNGTWSGVPSPTFTYQWTRNGSNISGATSSSYTIQSGDAGATLRCVVTGTNAAGSSSATSSNSYTPPGMSSTISLLVVAGGGGSGDSNGSAGAGAGQVYYRSDQPVTAGGAYSVSIGGGGAPGTYNNPGYRGSNGTSSSFSGPGISVSCSGGGGSGSENPSSARTGATGGSGGGGVRSYGGGGSGSKPTPYHYSNGGGANVIDGAPYYAGGSGGGASESGFNNNGNSSANRGGDGLYVGILASIGGSPGGYFGGGGGAGNYQTINQYGPRGGYGGGATAGGPANSPSSLRSGVANTGGGGAAYGTRDGDQGSHPPGSGGSGVVIVSYPNNFLTATSTTGSPTYTNSGGYHHYRFNGSGSITFPT